LADLHRLNLAASSGRGASEFKVVSEKEREEIELAELAAIDPTGGLDDLLVLSSPAMRRRFLNQVAETSAAIGLGPALMGTGSVETAETAAGTPITATKAP
jgi:hypothetical protein